MAASRVDDPSCEVVGAQEVVESQRVEVRLHLFGVPRLVKEEVVPAYRDLRKAHSDAQAVEALLPLHEVLDAEVVAPGNEVLRNLRNRVVLFLRTRQVDQAAYRHENGELVGPQGSRQASHIADAKRDRAARLWMNSRLLGGELEHLIAPVHADELKRWERRCQAYGRMPIAASDVDHRG